MHSRIARRNLLLGSAAAAGAAGFPAPAAAQASRTSDWRGLKLGVASYTLRKLPLEAAIQAIQRVGLRYVSIKDFHLPLATTAEQREAVARRFVEAGIIPMSCGVITTANNEAEIRRAFEYARDAGIPTIVGNPDPSSLRLVEKCCKEFDIRVAIHNHGPEDKRWPSPYEAWKAVEAMDTRLGVCIDVGHTARAGVDPAEAIRKCRARLYDVHLKDIHSTEPSGKPVEGGRGVLDLDAILKALLEIRYTYLVGIEYEKDPDDPLPGLFETVGYCRGLLRARP